MKITKEEEIEIREAIKSSRSMKSARERTKFSRWEFKNRAMALGLWNPAITGIEPANKLSKEDIAKGKWRGSSYDLKRKLLGFSLIEDKCCKCGWSEKRFGYEHSTCHLHHKNGDEKNNKLDNLELLCPNCHSLTPEYCVRKKNR